MFNDIKEEPVAILILGQKLESKRKIMNILVPRIEAGAEIYKYLIEQNKTVNIIISGGDVAGIGIKETDFMGNYLVCKKNIPISDIILENKSMTTYENMLFSIPLLSKFKSIILVTSDYHMERSEYILRSLSSNQNITTYPVFTINVGHKEKNKLIDLDKKYLEEFKTTMYGK